MTDVAPGRNLAREAFRRTPRVFDGLFLVLGLLALWQVLHLVAGDVAVASPAVTIARLAELLADPSFWPHLSETLLAFGQAFAVACTGGLAIGVVLGANRLASDVAEPILVAIYSLPKITLYPVILLLFGLGIEAKIAFGALHGIVPIAIFTLNAVRNVRPVYRRAARAMRLSSWQTVSRVLVPATIPEIATGLRIGFALTVLGTLIGELFASQRGVGFLLLRAMERNDVPTILALALLLLLFATASSIALLRLERRLHHNA